MPEIDQIATLDLQPNDVILVRFSRPVTRNVFERTRDAFAEYWPGVRVLIVEPGVEVGVYRPVSAKSNVGLGGISYG